MSYRLISCSYPSILRSSQIDPQHSPQYISYGREYVFKSRFITPNPIAQYNYWTHNKKTYYALNKACF